MTETETKLWDAGMQMKLALQHVDDEAVVRSCINSFISAARSVTFVMQSESSDAELKVWYDERMGALKQRPIFRFFNAQRVYSIHKGVVSPRKHSIPATDFAVNGVILAHETTATFYSFDGAGEYFPGGSGGVFRLCEEYFVLLKTLVRDWLLKRAELASRPTSG